MNDTARLAEQFERHLPLEPTPSIASPDRLLRSAIWSNVATGELGAR
jgi:hypothetical protein